MTDASWQTGADHQPSLDGDPMDTHLPIERAAVHVDAGACALLLTHNAKTTRFPAQSLTRAGTEGAYKRVAKQLRKIAGALGSHGKLTVECYGQGVMGHLTPLLGFNTPGGGSEKFVLSAGRPFKEVASPQATHAPKPPNQRPHLAAAKALGETGTLTCVYTDASVHPETGSAGVAWVRPTTKHRGSQARSCATDAQGSFDGEVKAIIMALLDHPGENMLICSDNRGALRLLDVATDANVHEVSDRYLPLLKELREAAQGRQVHGQWVRGHSGVGLNEQADLLARKAMRKTRKTLGAHESDSNEPQVAA